MVRGSMLACCLTSASMRPPTANNYKCEKVSITLILVLFHFRPARGKNFEICVRARAHDKNEIT